MVRGKKQAPDRSATDQFFANDRMIRDTLYEVWSAHEGSVEHQHCGETRSRPSERRPLAQALTRKGVVRRFFVVVVAALLADPLSLSCQPTAL